MDSDLEIARAANLKPIDSIAEEMGLSPDLVEPYGRHVMKIDLRAIEAARAPSPRQVRRRQRDHSHSAR